MFWRNRVMLLFDRIPLPAAFCDADGTIRSANPAMAAEWGTLPGRLRGRSALELFRPTAGHRLDPISEAVRLRRRSRYPVEVSWRTGTGAERRGEMTVDVLGDTPDAPLHLLLLLRIPDEPAEPPEAPRERPRVSEVEGRILALAAAGATTARIATAVGLTADGVNYHLGRLCRRWGVGNRAALIARAYVTGVLDPRAWPPVPADEPPAGRAEPPRPAAT